MSNTAERKPPSIELRPALPTRVHVYVQVELTHKLTRRPAGRELEETRRGAVEMIAGTRQWRKFQRRLG